MSFLIRKGIWRKPREALRNERRIYKSVPSLKTNYIGFTITV
jgi:hypothetical protein